MSPITAELIKRVVLPQVPTLAKTVLDAWKKEGVDEDTLPDSQSDLEVAIRKLVGVGDIKPSDLRKIKPEEVIAGVRAFQKLRHERPDGVLTQKLIEALSRDARCPDQGVDHDDSHVRSIGGTEAPEQHPDKNAFTIRYFIDESVRRIVGAKSDDLIKRAWESWLTVTKYLIVDWEKVDRTRANVVITMSPLTVLGKSKVAGPGNYTFPNLQIELNSTENWNDTLFQGTVCHEIGHFIGLSHSSREDQLMSPFIPNGVREPKPEDVERVQQIYQPTDRRPPRTDGFQMVFD